MENYEQSDRSSKKGEVKLTKISALQDSQLNSRKISMLLETLRGKGKKKPTKND